MIVLKTLLQKIFIEDTWVVINFVSIDIAITHPDYQIEGRAKILDDEIEIEINYILSMQNI